MTALEYHHKIEVIRNRLSSFRPDSVLARVMEHMHWSQVNNAAALGMPWVVLFMLKLSMQSSSPKGRDMTKREFDKVANEIYGIQHLACPLDQGNIQLMLRPMVLQQAWYQGDSLVDVKALTRQFMWYAGEDSLYDQQFRAVYGLTLKEFYLISLYILIGCVNDAKGVVGINLYDMFCKLSPSIPIPQILKYFAIVAIRSEDLPSFFLSHVVNGDLHQQSEYFQTTPLRKRPILLDGENLMVLHPKLFSRAIAMLIPDLLKQIKGWKFKDHFGPEMESYIGQALAHSMLEHFREDELNAFCRLDSVVQGKMADYMVPGDVNVIFESKAIEPGDIVSAVFDAEKLRSHLTDNFIKGVVQCQESVWRLTKTKRFHDAEFVGVVVTHEDFWFSSADDIVNYIDADLDTRVREKYGDLPMPFENIIFVTVDMVESLIEAVAQGDISLGPFLKDCIETLRTPAGKRFTMSHLIQEKLGGTIKGHPLLASKADEWLNYFQEAVEVNPRAWKGRVEELVQCRNAGLRLLHRHFDNVTAS